MAFPRGCTVILFIGAGSSAAPRPVGAQEEVQALPPLPIPVTNNAVAADTTGPVPHLYSLLGLDHTKRWSGITNRAFRLTWGDTTWRELPPVPGSGRLAATAQVVRGRLYLFGGYTVAENGTEHSLANTDIFDPADGRWRAGAPIPVPVDDAVSGVWRDSLVYLVSGWHDTDNVRLVQIYDPSADRWTTATPIPGPGVFGHSGGIVGDAIVFIDGVEARPARPRYAILPQAWRGTIDPADPTRIAWRPLGPHPGPARYRAAAGVCGGRLLFAGGTDNPYNYDGIGYDGVPSDPVAEAFAFDPATDGWTDTHPSPPRMDHRGLVTWRGTGWAIGGMGPDQRVLATAAELPLCRDARLGAAARRRSLQ